MKLFTKKVRGLLAILCIAAMVLTACGDGAGTTETEQETYRLDLLRSMADNKMQGLDESVFDEFYAFCEPYYGTYFMYEEAEAFCQQYPTQYDVGFLSTYGYGWNGSLWIVNFKAKEYDLEDYTNAVFSVPEDEYLIRDVTVSPRSVELTGPAEEIERLKAEGAEPMAPKRTQLIDDAEGFALYGKIEL